MKRPSEFLTAGFRYWIILPEIYYTRALCNMPVIYFVAHRTCLCQILPLIDNRQGTDQRERSPLHIVPLYMLSSIKLDLAEGLSLNAPCHVRVRPITHSSWGSGISSQAPCVFTVTSQALEEAPRRAFSGYSNDISNER
jgi:hypothetical protein